MANSNVCECSSYRPHMRGGVGGTLLACDDISEGHDSGQRLHQFYIDCGKLGGEGGIGCEKGGHGRVIMRHGGVIILLE